MTLLSFMGYQNLNLLLVFAENLSHLSNNTIDFKSIGGQNSDDILHGVIIASRKENITMIWGYVMKMLKAAFGLCLVIMITLDICSAADKRTLKAGVASMVTLVSAVKFYQQVVDYLGKNFRHPLR